MKRTNRCHRERKKLQGMLAANWQMLLLLLLFVLGMAWGCTAVKNSSDTLDGMLKTVLSGFVTNRAEHSFFATLFNALLPSLFLTLVVFLSGLSPAGLPVIAAVPMFRGFGLGVVSGYLYQTGGLKGVAYCMLTLYPHSILSVTALVLCCLEAGRMSMHFVALFRASGGPGINFSSEFKLYLARFAVFFGIIMSACILDAFLNKAFSSFFLL